MRWFINSTKESAGISNMPEYQIQINAIRKAVDQLENDAKMAFVNWHDKLHDKGIQINNILNHQGNQDERIERIEKDLEKVHEIANAVNKSIDNLTNLYMKLNNRLSLIDEYMQGVGKIVNDRLNSQHQNTPKQEVEKPVVKRVPKFRRLQNTFGDPKFKNAYAIAHGYAKAGIKQDVIATKLNGLGFKTPYGLEFSARHVSDLLCNPVQKTQFMQGIDKKAFL